MDKGISNTRTRKPMKPVPPGECSTPECTGRRIDGRRFCQPCADNLDRIRRELEDDPHLIFHKRSDNPKRTFTEASKKRMSAARACKFPGCFEQRISGTFFCDDHQPDDDES